MGNFLTDWFKKKPQPQVEQVNQAPIKPKKKDIKKTALPAQSRSSVADDDNNYHFLTRESQVIKPGYQFEVIPFIRKLSISNPDLSQALHNIVHLGNTGHLIKFDKKVTPERAHHMRRHLEACAEHWMDGVPGLEGVVNKFFRQLMIGGANAVEAVPNKLLTSLHRVILVKPESIRCKYERRLLGYEFYQYVDKAVMVKPNSFENLVKLNPNTFRYYALNGDTEVPYGNPPYLAAMGPIEDQKIMLDNIKFIIRQIGVLGFLELLVDKPDKNDGEGEEQYAARLQQFLERCKTQVEESMTEGVVVGYKEDHEFNFQTGTKNMAGTEALFGLNETQVASGLKSDPGLMGKGSAGAESHITIIFTKLIAELKNIQMIVAKTLEFIYNMELRLANFDYETLKVEFKPSTVQDELKLQQGIEIKIRNFKALYDDGLISQEQYAEAMDLEEPHLAEPRIERTIKGQTGGEDDSSTPSSKKQKREKGKDKSDKKSRSKDKPQDKKAYK